MECIKNTQPKKACVQWCRRYFVGKPSAFLFRQCALGQRMKKSARTQKSARNLNCFHASFLFVLGRVIFIYCLADNGINYLSVVGTALFQATCMGGGRIFWAPVHLSVTPRPWIFGALMNYPWLFCPSDNLEHCLALPTR